MERNYQISKQQAFWALTLIRQITNCSDPLTRRDLIY